MSWRVTTRADAEALRALLDAAHGPYPKRGKFTVAPGKSARRVPDIRENWNGEGELPIGWTAHHVEILDNPEQLGSSAVLLPPEDQREAALTAQQRAQLTAARAAARAQRPDWVPTATGGQANPRADGKGR